MTRAAARMLASLLLVHSPVAKAVAQQPVTFELQPGISIADFVSVPNGTESTTEFSLRFETRFPVNRWFNPVVGGVVRPYGSTGVSNRNTDAPTLFAGNVVRLVTAARTAGWISVELPLLVTHAPGAGASGNARDYGRDVVVLPTVRIHVGARGLGELGPPWSRFDVLLQAEQNLTPNRDALTGKRDRFNPVATVGLSLSVGVPGRSG